MASPPHPEAGQIASPKDYLRIALWSAVSAAQAANLFLRRQLALYVEWGIKPERIVKVAVAIRPATLFGSARLRTQSS